MIIEIDEILLENIKTKLKENKFFLKEVIKDLRGSKRCLISKKI